MTVEANPNTELTMELQPGSRWHAEQLAEMPFAELTQVASAILLQASDVSPNGGKELPINFYMNKPKYRTCAGGPKIFEAVQLAHKAEEGDKGEIFVGYSWMSFEPGQITTRNHMIVATLHDLDVSEGPEGLFWTAKGTATLHRYQRRNNHPHPTDIQQGFMRTKLIEGLSVCSFIDSDIDLDSMIAGEPYPDLQVLGGAALTRMQHRFAEGILQLQS